MSVEIERWNLLVCQLTDLQALARFIANLTIRTGNEKNALDRSGSIGISVVGKNVIQAQYFNVYIYFSPSMIRFCRWNFNVLE